MLGEASTLAITIITVSFFSILVLAGILVARVVRDPDKAIGARTRQRWEEHEDARRLEQERRRLEEERRLGEEPGQRDGPDDDGPDGTDGPHRHDEEGGTHE